MSPLLLSRTVGLSLALFLSTISRSRGDETPSQMREALPQALSEADFARMLASVDRGLAWLTSQQDADGSFRSSLKEGAQPALTALSVMAYLSRGHRPGAGPCGAGLDRAIDFALLCQKSNGIFAWRNSDDSAGGGATAVWQAKQTDTYNHAITLLMLGEVYGLTTGERSLRVRLAIEKGLQFTHQFWAVKGKSPKNEGGWRYFTFPHESDLSVTGWHALSLRSVKNAGFDVPKEVMDRVATYIRRCYSADKGRFAYMPDDDPSRAGVAMTGAGVLCLALFGDHQHPFVLAGGATLARQDFSDPETFNERPYYTCYYVSQAAAQLGGNLWLAIYRKTTAYLLGRQERNGCWAGAGDAQYGPVYSTSMALLALTPQLQLLPIYQH